MRVAWVFSVLIAAASAAIKMPSLLHAESVDTKDIEATSDVTVVRPSSYYVVKLDCLGCAMAIRGSTLNTSLDRNRDNFLKLTFGLDWTHKALIANEHRVIFPQQPRPFFLDARQIPSDPPDILTDLLKPGRTGPFGDRFSEALSKTMNFPLRYEYSILKNETNNQIRVQFDVKGLVGIKYLEDYFPPVSLDKKGQKLVEVLLNVEKSTQIISIESVEVVDREHRVQPFRTRYGRLAMEQTYFDPSEWDQYGKLGTWSRTFEAPVGKSGALLLCSIVVLIALGIIAASRWSEREPVNSDESKEQDEKALLKAYYDDAPSCVERPAIKIEEHA